MAGGSSVTGLAEALLTAGDVTVAALAARAAALAETDFELGEEGNEGVHG